VDRPGLPPNVPFKDFCSVILQTNQMRSTETRKSSSDALLFRAASTYAASARNGPDWCSQ
jgi:hypothetical protein